MKDKYLYISLIEKYIKDHGHTFDSPAYYFGFFGGTIREDLNLYGVSWCNNREFGKDYGKLFFNFTDRKTRRENVEIMADQLTAEELRQLIDHHNETARRFNTGEVIETGTAYYMTEGTTPSGSEVAPWWDFKNTNREAFAVCCCGGFPYIICLLCELNGHDGGGWDLPRVATIKNGAPVWSTSAEILTKEGRDEVTRICKEYKPTTEKEING